MSNSPPDTLPSPNTFREFHPYPRPFWAEIRWVRFLRDGTGKIIIYIPWYFYEKFGQLYWFDHPKDLSCFFEWKSVLIVQSDTTIEDLGGNVTTDVQAIVSWVAHETGASSQNSIIPNTVENITSVQSAVRLTEDIFQEVLVYIASNVDREGGLFEKDVIDEIKKMFSDAWWTPAEDIIFATEENTFHAHYRIPLGGRWRKMERWDIALLDLGILFPRDKWWCSDFTRTFTIGKPWLDDIGDGWTEDQKKIKDIVDAMYEASARALRPWKTLEDITEASMDILRQEMNEKYDWDASKVKSVENFIYPYYVWHHIDAHSQHPDIGSKVAFRSGMLVTIEPWLHFHSKIKPLLFEKWPSENFWYRNEDIYLITQSGAIRLSEATREQIDAAVEAGKTYIPPQPPHKS